MVLSCVLVCNEPFLHFFKRCPLSGWLTRNIPASFIFLVPILINHSHLCFFLLTLCLSPFLLLHANQKGLLFLPLLPVSYSFLHLPPWYPDAIFPLLALRSPRITRVEIRIAVSTQYRPPPRSLFLLLLSHHLHHSLAITKSFFPLVQFQSCSPYISRSVRFLISSPTLLSLSSLSVCLSFSHSAPFLLSSVYNHPLIPLSPPPLCPASLCLHLCSRKKVAINKAAMSYRQEKNRKLSSLDCSMTEQSTLQQDERMAHSFMDAHGCNARSKTARSIWVLLRKCLEWWSSHLPDLQPCLLPSMCPICSARP